jgi:hypothetical protein
VIEGIESLKPQFKLDAFCKCKRFEQGHIEVEKGRARLPHPFQDFQSLDSTLRSREPWDLQRRSYQTMPIWSWVSHIGYLVRTIRGASRESKRVYAGIS